MDDKTLVLEMIAYMEKNLSGEIGTRDLVSYSGYSLNRLRDKFFHVTGDTPSGYLRKRRLTEAAKEILSGGKIVDVCLKYGYSSQDNFTTSFRSYFGVTPKEIYAMDRKYRRFVAQLRGVFNIMELSELKQPDFCSTLMGSIKGAADYYDLDLSQSMLFGLSGHAFLTNIHKDLCPSGPYAWSKSGFFRCLANMGIEIINEYWFERGASKEAREEMDEIIKKALNKGRLCILEFLEYQLISGYDEKQFYFTLPWNCQAHSEIRSLDFSDWDACLGKEGFVGFKIIGKREADKDFAAMLKEALSYGLELYRSPAKYQCEGYQIGYGAWESWIGAVEAGHGDGQGNWWNGMVWSENKKVGSVFFEESGEMLDSAGAKKSCANLASLYRAMSERLDRIKERDLAADEKIKLLRACLADERKAEKDLGDLLAAIA